jgi:DNA-binding transcriptional MerR regulator
VTNSELMTIGRFARISGLSVHALRHYDEVGILTPAEVDADSGYRRYRRAQVHDPRERRRWSSRKTFKACHATQQ